MTAKFQCQKLSDGCCFKREKVGYFIGVEIWLYFVVWTLKHWQRGHTCQKNIEQSEPEIQNRSWKRKKDLTQHLRELEEFYSLHFAQTEYQYPVCPRPCKFETFECQICQDKTRSLATNRWVRVRNAKLGRDMHANWWHYLWLNGPISIRSNQ